MSHDLVHKILDANTQFNKGIRNATRGTPLSAIGNWGYADALQGETKHELNTGEKSLGTLKQGGYSSLRKSFAGESQTDMENWSQGNPDYSDLDIQFQENKKLDINNPIPNKQDKQNIVNRLIVGGVIITMIWGVVSALPKIIADFVGGQNGR